MGDTVSSNKNTSEANKSSLASVSEDIAGKMDMSSDNELQSSEEKHQDTGEPWYEVISSGSSSGTTTPPVIIQLIDSGQEENAAHTEERKQIIQKTETDMKMEHSPQRLQTSHDSMTDSKVVESGTFASTTLTELKGKVRKLEHELCASKDTSITIQQELNQLDAQHGEAIMKLKEEIENLNQLKIEELNKAFMIELDEELKHQALELNSKHMEEINKYNKEIIFYKETEKELKEKLNAITAKSEQLNEIQVVDNVQENKALLKASPRQLVGRDLRESIIKAERLLESEQPYPLKRSRSCDAIAPIGREKKILHRYESYISAVRQEYEEKIQALQREIVQCHSSVGAVTDLQKSSLQNRKFNEDNLKSPDLETSQKLGMQELQQEIYDEINKKFEVSVSNLKSDYEQQIQNLTEYISALQSDSASCELENKLQQGYDENIAKLKHEFDDKIAKLKEEHEIIVNKLTKDLEQAKSEKLSAEKKVKADMFVWHEETVTQLKHNNEEYISQLRKEYEEKMELYREELQEEFDAEKDRILEGHKNEIAQLENRHDNLVEGIRTGKASVVADIVQQRFDMELEMAKALIQQECEEIIEAEQIHLTEQYEEQMNELIMQKNQELEEQKVQYEKEIKETRNSIHQQYESQIKAQANKTEICELNDWKESKSQDEVDIGIEVTETFAKETAVERHTQYITAMIEASKKYDKLIADTGVEVNETIVKVAAVKPQSQYITAMIEASKTIFGMNDWKESKSQDEVDIGVEVTETIVKETAVKPQSQYITTMLEASKKYDKLIADTGIEVNETIVKETAVERQSSYLTALTEASKKYDELIADVQSREGTDRCITGMKYLMKERSPSSTEMQEDSEIDEKVKKVTTTVCKSDPCDKDDIDSGDVISETLDIVAKQDNTEISGMNNWKESKSQDEVDTGVEISEIIVKETAVKQQSSYLIALTEANKKYNRLFAYTGVEVNETIVKETAVKPQSTYLTAMIETSKKYNELVANTGAEVNETIIKETAVERQSQYITAMIEASKKYDELIADTGVEVNETMVKETVMERQSPFITALIEASKKYDELIADTDVEDTETIVKEIAVEKHAGQKYVDTSSTESDLVTLSRQELFEKMAEYEAIISQQNASHKEEIRMFTEKLSSLESEYQGRIREMEEKRELELEMFEERLDKLKEGIPVWDDTEVLELTHQVELQDMGHRLIQEHKHEINHLEIQHQSKLDNLSHKYRDEQLQHELTDSSKMLQQYTESCLTLPSIPSFLEEIMEGILDNQAESANGTIVPLVQNPAERSRSDMESERQIGTQETTETQVLVSRFTEDQSEKDEDVKSDPQESIDDDGDDVHDGDDEGDDEGDDDVDASMSQYSSPLHGNDYTQGTELVEFASKISNESMDEIAESEKSDSRSIPPALLQTLRYGDHIPDVPTVKNLDYTINSIKMAPKEKMVLRIRDLETEVKELRYRLQSELSMQADMILQLDNKKQEENKLVAMLQADMECLNQDRDTLLGNNEHLLRLLSDTVKTYMNLDESIVKTMKLMTEKAPDISKYKSIDNRSPGSAELTGTLPPHKSSPVASPWKHSPVRAAEDGDGAHETSVLSNITDEGLELSQRISNGIFHGPELSSEEEELLIDSGSRLQSSVSHILKMLEETTGQLLYTRENQVDMMATLEGKGDCLKQLTSRCHDLEEQLKEEDEKQDFLVLELHKAEGLIEGYTFEQESLENHIRELEEQKETLVLELETMKNKLHNQESVHSQNELMKREIKDQQQVITNNVGEDVQALMLEVSRLNSENQQKDELIKQVHDEYETRVRELETGGEDMESHYGKLLDDMKQEVADLKQQVEALEKQLKVKKQFIEEQSAEREQEHEDYQKELDMLKKTIQDIEKQNNTGSRLHGEINELSEQLENQKDQYQLIMQDLERYQAQILDKDLSLSEHKSVIQQLEQDLHEKADELELSQLKLAELEGTLSSNPCPDDDPLVIFKCETGTARSGMSLEFDDVADQECKRWVPQMTIEEEMRQASEKTKEELICEKHTLQTQVNDLLVETSSLRNQLDVMRHRRGFDEVSDVMRTLEYEREKSEDKDTQISELRVKIEQLAETVCNRDQQIEQFVEQRERSRGKESCSVVGVELERDTEIERQMMALKRENKQLQDRVKFLESTSITDMSGLSQNLLLEKNQEIDYLSEQIICLQSKFSELKTKKGIDNVASIQQEMEESVSSHLEKMSSLESELLTLNAALHNKEERMCSMENDLSSLRKHLHDKEKQIIDLQATQKEGTLCSSMSDVTVLQAVLQEKVEKEELVNQLTEQIENLQSEVNDLSDFQYKMQEDFDIVQSLLETKDGEIESLTKELTMRSLAQTDEHAILMKHEVEIARLKTEVEEKDYVIADKMKRIAEFGDKIELLETLVAKYKKHIEDFEDHILVKESPHVIPSSFLQIDHKSDSGLHEMADIGHFSTKVEAIPLGRQPSSLDVGDHSDDVMIRLRSEVERLKQQVLESSLSEDDKFSLVCELQFETEQLRKPVNVAMKIKPPSPQLDDDEKSKLINQQIIEIQDLKKQVAAALSVRTQSPSMSEDEKLELIKEQQEEIEKLQNQAEDVFEVVPPIPPLSEDLKDRIIEQIRFEIKVLRIELNKVTEAFENGEHQSLLVQKIEEVIQLQKKLQESKSEMEGKYKEIRILQEHVKKLEEKMEFVKKEKSYEEKTELSEKQNEIEELQAELEGFRTKIENNITKSLDLEMSLCDTRTQDPKQLVRSMSFYKDQYEEKSSETRQLMVQLDLVRSQLEKVRNETVSDSLEEIEIFKVELERKVKDEIQELKETIKNLCQEKEVLGKELHALKISSRQNSDEREENIEIEIQSLKEEIAKERLDSVQAINDLQALRARTEKEQKDYLKTIQEFEQDRKTKLTKESELNSKVEQLSEELTFLKKQLGIEGNRSETGTDIERLQQQILNYKLLSDKAQEYLAEKEIYQSQVLQLEIQNEQLQKQMKADINALEEQLRTCNKQLNKEVLTQLHATQERLENTVLQLSETGQQLNETEAHLNQANEDLNRKNIEILELQKDLQNISGQFAITSTKLQDSEEKLRMTIGHVTEREDQIYQLQKELQHMQQEAEQFAVLSRITKDKSEDIERICKQLLTTQVELENVKKSLKESVKMSEQQLQMIEYKDQEYIKLKLVFQQTIGDKDKTIREQKQNLTEQDQALFKVRQEIDEKEQKVINLQQTLMEREENRAAMAEQIENIKESSPSTLGGSSVAGGSTGTMGVLQAQPQNQEQVILSLQTNLHDVQKAVHESNKEIDNVYKSYDESKDESKDEAKDETKDDAKDEAKDESKDEAKDEAKDKEKEAVAIEALHKDIAVLNEQLLKLQSSEEGGQVLISDFNMDTSPFDQSGQELDGNYEVRIVYPTIGQSPGQSGHGQTPGQSPDQSFGPNRLTDHLDHYYLENLGQQFFDTQNWVMNPEFSVKRESASFHQIRGQKKQQMLDNNVLDSKYRADDNSKSSQIDENLITEEETRQCDSFNGEIEEFPIVPDASDGVEVFFLGDIHMAKTKMSKTQNRFGSLERYIGENGQFYDTHGNLRPHFLKEGEGYHGDHSQFDRHQVTSQKSLESESQRDSGDIPVYNFEDENLQSSQGQHDLEAESRSSKLFELERCVQQLRKELLFTKTALMQLQRRKHLEEQDQRRELLKEQNQRRECLEEQDVDDVHATFSQVEPNYNHLVELICNTVPTSDEFRVLRQRLEKAEKEVEMYTTLSGITVRDCVQKVISLKDELMKEHEQQISELAAHLQEDIDTQVAALQARYTAEIEYVKNLHDKELKEQLQDLQKELQTRHNSKTNKLILQHQHEVGQLKTRAGMDHDNLAVNNSQQQPCQDDVGGDYHIATSDVQSTDTITDRLQTILNRLHSEGVQVLSISELELLRHTQSQADITTPDADIEAMKVCWDNERQSLLSMIQSLKELLAQTHKLHGFDQTLEGSDWRGELLQAIGYVFSKERDELLAELRAHVLCHPTTDVDKVQKLEQRISTMESHHHSALDQIFVADRQSMLAEIRDLRAHATILHFHQQDERGRQNAKLSSKDESAFKKERQLKRQIQLLEFKIQQEKVLQEDLQTSLEAEHSHVRELATQLNLEKENNHDLQSVILQLQSQIVKLGEALDQEQNHCKSIIIALKEERCKSLNLSDQLEYERQSLVKVQKELESLRQQQHYINLETADHLQTELSAECDRCLGLEDQMEVNSVTVQNLRKDVEMERCRHHAVKVELAAKISHLQKSVDAEKQKQEEIRRTLDSEQSQSVHLQQSLEAEKLRSHHEADQDTVNLEHLRIELETEHANLTDLKNELKLERAAREELESDRSLLTDRLCQERAVSGKLQQEVCSLQFEQLEVVKKLHREQETNQCLKTECDRILEELRHLKSHDIQRDQEHEVEKLSSKKAAQEAERDRENYNRKLHEQELEAQHLLHKVEALQKQLAECQENELKATHDLGKIRLETNVTVDAHDTTILARTSPHQVSHQVSDGTTSDWREHQRLQKFHSQLECMCQSLHYLILLCKEQLNKVTHSGPWLQSNVSSFEALQQSVQGLLSEVKQVKEMEGDFMMYPSRSVNERILRQNEELINFVACISEEKTELRNALAQLEEDIWQYRQMDTNYQTVQRSAQVMDSQIIGERMQWAKEKLALQTALNSTVREVNLLQASVHTEREHAADAVVFEVNDCDSVKIQRLYEKYLRAESFRKALIYQKKYLLLLLGGFQDTEETTLALLSHMGAVDGRTLQGNRRRPVAALRAAVRVVIALHRMKGMVNKWRQATGVGSEVVGGPMDPVYGYMPTASSFSSSRHNHSPCIVTTMTSLSPSPRYNTSPFRQTPTVLVSETNAQLYSTRHNVNTTSPSSYQPYTMVSTCCVPNTPPTKDYNTMTQFHLQSSGARRKLLTSIISPRRKSPQEQIAQNPVVRESAQEHMTSSNINNTCDIRETDEYIKRLESLNSKIGTLKNVLGKVGKIEVIDAVSTQVGGIYYHIHGDKNATSCSSFEDQIVAVGVSVCSLLIWLLSKLSDKI